MLRYSYVALVLFFCECSFSSPTKTDNGNWWNYQYFYQLNIQSYKDSNGDGIGDIKGIVSELVHLESLGVNSVILSPIFESIKDCENSGINDFMKIDSDYGSIEDFDELIAKSTKADLKIILDLPLDKISPHSDWFNSSANKIQGYENYFKWIDKDSKKEDLITYKQNDSSMCIEKHTNHQWTWNDIRKQEYGSQTKYKYPLLNFKEFNVITDIKTVLKYWLDRGVYGFRFEAIPVSNEYDNDFLYMIHHLRSFIDRYSKENSGLPRILIGESNKDAQFIYKRNKYFMEDSFHVNFVDTFISGFDKGGNARDAKFTVDKSMTFNVDDNKPNWIIGNSHVSRVSSRVGQSHAELTAVMAFILPGNVIIYQGDEIGMTDVEILSKGDIKTELCDNYFEDFDDYPKTSSKSPFQWNDSANAGFGNNLNTWLPVNKNYNEVNLIKQKKNKNTRYKLYRILGSFRQSQILKEGDSMLKILSDNILVLMRYLDEHETFVVVMNFGPHTEIADLSKFKQLTDELTVIISSEYSTYVLGDKVSSSKVKLASGEAIVLMAPYKNCHGSKPVDKIISKLSDAMQKINSYLSFRDIKEGN